jgi:superkiller protein 3
MRRNYAAALQDDAQQVLNIMLKSGLTEDVLANVNVSLVYKNYPNYLERAAALLGKDHYMFNILHARKYFFEGRIKEYRKERRPLYRKAMELQPNMAHAMVEMIRSSEANQLDSVNYYFKKATELVPSWEEPYLAMSSFYQFRMKDIENAEELLNLAGQVDSNSVLVWFKKGRFYYKQKNYQLAEKWLLKTIQSTGDDICFPCAHNVLGFVYWGMEQDEEAMHHFKKAIKSDSINLGKNKSFCRPCAYINIGAFYSNFENRYDEAEQYFLKALKIDSTIVVAYVNLGVVSEKKNKLDLAEQYFLKALELNPSDELGFINLIGLYVKAKRYNDADQLCKRTLELNPSYINGYNVLGLAYKENQQYEKAIHPFEQVLQLDSTFWWAYANLGEIYQNMKRWEEMATVVEKAIEYAPPTGILFNMLGNAYNHIPGRLKEVKNMLEKSLELSPELPSTYIYLAQWYLKNDQKEDAWSFLNQGLDKGYDEYEYLQSESDFEVLRKTPEWNELMQKYFPEQDKK